MIQSIDINNFGFFDCYRNRNLDGNSGRFLQEDSHPGFQTLPSSLNNAYIYAVNNPFNRTDSSGKSSFLKDLSIVLGASLAGAWAGGLAGGAIGGPWGFVAGVVVGAIAGAVTAVAINGTWNSIEGKEFFAGWQSAAIMGAIAGGIAGGVSSYNNIYSSGRSPAGEVHASDSIENFIKVDISGKSYWCLGQSIVIMVSGGVALAEVGKIATSTGIPQWGVGLIGLGLLAAGGAMGYGCIL